MLKKLLLVLLLTGIVFATTSDNYVPIEYNCDGGTTEFTFEWPIENTSDVEVILKLTSTEAEEVLIEYTHYDVSATNNDYTNGGTITTVAIYANTYTLIIRRDTPKTQQSVFEDTRTIRIAAIESGQDKLTRLVQDLYEIIGRCLKIPKTETSDVDLVSISNRADKNITFDSTTGDVSLTSVLSTGSASISAWGETFINDDDAAEARETIGLDTDDDVEFGTLKVTGPWIDVTHSDYGADSTGTADSTTAIQTAISDLVAAGRGTLYFPPGDYLVVPSATGVVAITDLTDFRIVGDSARIFCDPILINGGDQGNKRMFYLINCSRFSISGFRFVFQMDFASAADVGTRNDQIVNIYYDSGFAHTNGDVRDFNVFNNTFEYIGPQLDDPVAGKNSRLSILIINSETALSPARHVRDFKVYGNTFRRCTGRVIYTLLAENGAIFGNTFEELGYMVHPGGDYETYAEAVGIRILGSANISVTGNVLDGYSGDLVNEGGKGGVFFLVTDQGTATGICENITFTGNTIIANKVDGIAVILGNTYSTSVIGNTILGDETNGYEYFSGIRYVTGPTVDTLVANNIIKYIPHIFYTLHTNTYTNNIVEGNLITKGTNHQNFQVNNADINLIFGRNYISDDGWIDGRDEVYYENEIVSCENETVYSY